MTNCRMLYGPAAVRTCFMENHKKSWSGMQRAVSRDSRRGEGRKRNSRHGGLRTETAVMGDPKTETAEGNKILSAAVF